MYMFVIWLASPMALCGSESHVGEMHHPVVHLDAGIEVVVGIEEEHERIVVLAVKILLYAPAVVGKGLALPPGDSSLQGTASEIYSQLRFTSDQSRMPSAPKD